MKRIIALIPVLMGLLISCKQNVLKEELAEFQFYPTHVPLEGEDNFRDMGGFVGAEGKRVKYRKLFRSGELSALTDSDMDTMAKLNLDQIIDLRTAFEVEEKPDRIQDGTQVYFLPLMENDPSGNAVNADTYIKGILTGEMDTEKIFTEAYGTIDTLKLETWEEIFDLLESGKTTLWHCTAGQDRAGMTAALVLASLGVSQEDIVKDYLATDTYLANYKSQTAEYIAANYGDEAGQKVGEAFKLKEEYINKFFEAVNNEFGSMENFLTALGVDREAMRKNYLEN